jgi:hypothetical protein
MDDHTKDSKKSSHILVLITHQWNIGAWVHSWLGYTKGISHPKITFKTLL